MHQVPSSVSAAESPMLVPVMGVLQYLVVSQHLSAAFSACVGWHGGDWAQRLPRCGELSSAQLNCPSRCIKRRNKTRK